jgi:hypothetical protein
MGGVVFGGEEGGRKGEGEGFVVVVFGFGVLFFCRCFFVALFSSLMLCLTGGWATFHSEGNAFFVSGILAYSRFCVRIILYVLHLFI